MGINTFGAANIYEQQIMARRAEAKFARRERECEVLKDEGIYPGSLSGMSYAIGNPFAKEQPPDKKLLLLTDI